MERELPCSPSGWLIRPYTIKDGSIQKGQEGDDRAITRTCNPMGNSRWCRPHPRWRRLVPAAPGLVDRRLHARRPNLHHAMPTGMLTVKYTSFCAPRQLSRWPSRRAPSRWQRSHTASSSSYDRRTPSAWAGPPSIIRADACRLHAAIVVQYSEPVHRAVRPFFPREFSHSHRDSSSFLPWRTVRSRM